MSCTRWRERLDELASGELHPQSTAETLAHLSGCAGCTRAFEETRATIALLRGLGDERLPDGFEAALHRALVTAPAPARPGALARFGSRVGEILAARPLVSGGLGASFAAAALAVAFAVHPGPAHRPLAPLAAGPSGEVPPVFFVPKEKVAVVRIDFQAEQAIDNVEFAIKLPEGLHFVSEGRELPDREFHWRGHLDRGSNPIPIAVRGERPGRYTLAAHAVGPDVQAKHDVVLEVTS